MDTAVEVTFLSAFNLVAKVWVGSSPVSTQCTSAQDDVIKKGAFFSSFMWMNLIGLH